MNMKHPNRISQLSFGTLAPSGKVETPVDDRFSLPVLVVKHVQSCSCVFNNSVCRYLFLASLRCVSTERSLSDMRTPCKSTHDKEVQ